MSITVNATDANQRFAEILGKAVAGETVIITKHGEPVAQLTPYRPEAASPERKTAQGPAACSVGKASPPPQDGPGIVTSCDERG